MHERTATDEMPASIKMLRGFTLFVSGIFTLATMFTLTLVFFAPGPIRVEDRMMMPSEFRGLGVVTTIAAALIAIAMTAATIGISRRREWFRKILMAVAGCVVAGGAAANLFQGSVAMATATIILGAPAFGLVWFYLYRNQSINHYLGE
jgi:VIT1/CCC1 family predicted Fe2+/Mn2+ transporter